MALAAPSLGAGCIYTYSPPCPYSMNTREKKTVSKMIRIYCRSKHGLLRMLCSDCAQLEAYAHARLERCPFGEAKPVCHKCAVHCYRAEHRQKIREVMRFSGPRMLLHHPVDALQYLCKRLK